MSDGTIADCLLILAVPSALEDEVLDLLSARPECADGVMVMRGNAAGGGVPLNTTIEQVRGRAARVFIQIEIGREAAGTLVDALTDELARARIRWWLVPLLASGRIGDGE